MEDFGVEVTYTEMVSDMGLIYGNKETESYITYKKPRSITGVQLFGSSKETLAKAASIVLEKNPHVDFIDVNMACPVPKVTKTGAGSSLLKDPKLCGDIIREIKKVTNKPVTAKIRLGWNDKSLNYLEVIKELEEAGVALIALHARTTKDLYSGLPRFELIRDLRKKMNVPLAISGNIYTLEDAVNAIEITGADAVMVARGGVGNPRLIKDINDYYQNKEKELPPSLDEQIDYCLRLARNFIEEKGEEKALRIYRGIASKFFMGFPNAKPLKNSLTTKLVDYNSLISLIDEYKNSTNN